MKNDDAHWVQSVLAGNRNDFDKLWHKYQLDAERWAFRHVQTLFEAEDIVQQAFTEAYCRLSTLKQPHKFGGWLRGIVTNIAVSWFRQRRRVVPFEEISGIFSDGKWVEQHYNRYDVLAPADMVERQERVNGLHAAMGTLTSKYRDVITMFYFKDASHKEIAAHLNVSVAAVKGLLHRARAQLKEEMEKDERRTGESNNRDKE